MLRLIGFMLKPWLRFSHTDNFNDNQSGKSVPYNETINRRSKHIEMVMNKYFKPHYMPTADLVADILTKPFSESKFELLQNKFGLKPFLKSMKY